MAKHTGNGHQTETPDVSHIRNVEVTHESSDVNVRAVGRLGRSHGCPALRPSIARSVIDTIKQGSLVFAYYPDKNWLQGSRFLNGCS